MDAARRGKWIGFLCLGVTAFGWALNWPLMKLLLQQWPPLFARGLAGVAAALILFAIAKARGQPLEVPREAIPRLSFASFTNVFAWMGFGTMAMVGSPSPKASCRTPCRSGHPCWLALAGARPKRDMAALGLGVCGLVVLFASSALRSIRESSPESCWRSPPPFCLPSAPSSAQGRSRLRRLR